MDQYYEEPEPTGGIKINIKCWFPKWLVKFIVRYKLFIDKWGLL